VVQKGTTIAYIPVDRMSDNKYYCNIYIVMNDIILCYVVLLLDIGGGPKV